MKLCLQDKQRSMRLKGVHLLFIFSAIFRLLLIVYGEWQDSHMTVRYTDVDYLVFTDAASFVTHSESPFRRITYRYSPFLAYLLVPNIIVHRSWGKILFSTSDMLVGWLIFQILRLRKVPYDSCLFSVMTWLFNPFVFTIGTRGNCEPIACAMILWMIACLLKGDIIQAAIWYGFVVHFRIYPVIYALPIIISLDQRVLKPGQKTHQAHKKSHPFNSPKSMTRLPTKLRAVLTKERLGFSLVAGGVFVLLNGVCWYLYGWEYLNKAVLYHLMRTDPRHNFSIYFYHIYLGSHVGFTLFEKLLSFLPQMILQLVLALCFARDLPFCFFLQTLAFVSFNKVITAQYFVWFFCLLPLILPWSNMKIKWDGAMCFLLWSAAQTHWLYWGYALEFKGINVFLQLWLASLCFLAMNTFLLITLIRKQCCVPFFQSPKDAVNNKSLKSE